MYADSALSLIPPVGVIILVFLTRRVVLSLFVGILLAGILLSQSLLGTIEYVFYSLIAVFYDQNGGEIVYSNFYIFGFLVILGILTQAMSYSGGMAAFVYWARKRIKSATGSEFFAFIAGIIIFIDDYFNALTVGQISQSINDINRSTRERLAYIIDSTSAPVCILMPLSSWGAYIIGLLGGMQEGNHFQTLLSSIWSNFYAWFALLAVFLTIYWRINLPAMRKNCNVGVQKRTDGDSKGTSIWFLILPIFVLIVLIAFFLFYSGFVQLQKQQQEVHLIAILGEAQTPFALFYGGLLTLVFTLFLTSSRIHLRSFPMIFNKGFMIMLPANLILIFAWAIAPAIREDLQTGIYLAKISEEWLQMSLMNPDMIVPIVLFLVSGFIAFATGTSWGTFAIMLPIALGIAEVNHFDTILCIAAVLSGAVYGDHASPISDTTILSATGAGCSVQSHFITQFPYVTTVACVALVSFGVAGITNVWLGYLVGGLLLLGIFGIYKRFYGGEIVLKS
ncbi:sodium:proton antiporter [Helicobacter monodelphidis]|uniref:Na+/H+ antiporter NhaC family protein n=1 Tax=Helicobacter sp. 15-1451 TaxID=2004995 RepID=UPI000DCF21DA|nr:Na+/H+ antiporter NhaC family protein [Helicobacter sp. 15-1451]RAX58164.1 sodium:proton antiporter [Helicobacter sp. 15-1451]